MINIVVSEVVVPSDPAKKQGVVVDTQGRKWMVWRDKLDQFVPGRVYEITNTVSRAFQGKTYVTIKEFHPAEQVVVGRGGAGGSSSVPSVVRSSPAMAAPAAASNGVEEKRRMDIFVCGLVNNAVSAGAVDIMSMADMISMVERFKEVWRRTLGPNAGRSAQPSPQADRELDDEIPFS